jgi:hypothetical protein
MAFEPEFVKELLGHRRYEALMGAIGGVGMNLDVAEDLVKKYDPPRTHSWQIPDADELAKQLKQTKAAFDGFHRSVRQFEADLMAKEWSAN